MRILWVAFFKRLPNLFSPRDVPNGLALIGAALPGDRSEVFLAALRSLEEDLLVLGSALFSVVLLGGFGGGGAFGAA